jgi:hypothetical protein
MFDELKAGFSFLSGQRSFDKKNGTAEKMINYLVYQRRKKTIMNKAG